MYTTSNSDRWTTNHNKQHRWIGNYNFGDAYFVIPKFPFRGEITAYHFMQAQDYWNFYKRIGKISPSSRLIVVNANDRFTQFDADADAFIRETCEKNGIEVLYNTELTEVKGKQLQLTLQLADGRREERDFNNLYVIPRGLPQQSLREAGLADAQGFFDVNPTTLQSRKFENIWGIGDINNLPVTKSYWAAFHQLHCVRYNLVKAFKGVPLHAPYDGYTASPFLTSANTATWFERDYNGPKRGHLRGSTNSFVAGRVFASWTGIVGKQQKVQLGKNDGPHHGFFRPYGKYYKGEPIPTGQPAEYVAAPKAN